MCARCQAEKPRFRRVYVYFMHRDGWHYCQFVEADLRTPLPKKLTFPVSDRIFELADRGGYVMNLEGRQTIEHGIEKGRGGIWLLLTDEQYQTLRKP